MKKVFIVHGWGGNPDEAMLKWIREELQKRGFEVIAPAMPDTNNPKINIWVGFLADLVKSVDENTYFIGHSVGCQTVLRYLETLPDNINVGGTVLIAPWVILTLENLDESESPEIAKPWIETPIDYEKVKKTTKNIIAILSDNDPFVPLNENKEIFKERLNARTIILHNKGHFTEDDGITELPEALEALEKMMNK